MALLYHVGLTVTNLERSVAFYRDVAGMEPQGTPRVIRDDSEYDRLVNTPGVELKVLNLTAGSFMLQLIEYTAAGGTTLDLHHNNIGSPHLCFYVDDVAQKYDELWRRGDVIVTSPVVQHVKSGVGSFYVEDPDGVPVEFYELPAGRRSELPKGIRL
jgi:catechol 2,3-dioxygenase-like lactoylglutathione lyase family enzyme